MRKYFAHWAAVASLLVLVGCGGFSQTTTQAAADLSKRIAEQNSLVDAKHGVYKTNVLGHPEYKTFLVFYATRENWANHFNISKEKAKYAAAAYEKNVKPLLDSNDSAKESALLRELQKANVLLGESNAWMNRPFERRDFILDARKRAPELVASAGKALASTNPLVEGLAAVAAGTKIQFPQRVADIDKRYNGVNQIQQQSVAAYATAVAEHKKFQAGQFTDFVLLADSAKRVMDNSNRVREDTMTQTQQLGSLGTTYSKTLIDMRSRHWVTVERSSWNESADYPTTHVYRYAPVEVTGSDIGYFDALPPSLDYIARLTRGWTGDSLDVQIDRGKWNALKVQPRESWPDSSDDTAEFGMTDEAKYYHRYAIAHNNGVTESAWEEVTEAFYEDHADDLGMEIESKPASAFADETSRHAAPAGMSLVGNSQYGQWRTGSDGNSFWEFYGKYRLFSDLLSPVGGNPYYYRRSEWDNWNNNYRGRREYYGEEGDKEKKERYGTYGYVTSTGNHYSSRIPEIRRSAERASGFGFGGGGGRGGSSSRGGGK